MPAAVLSLAPTIVLALCVGTTASIASPAPVSAGGGPPAAQFRADVGLVTVPVVVFDDDGVPIPDLTPADFRVFDDGVEQQLEILLSPRDTPLEIALALDFSSSIEESAPRAREDAHRLLDALQPADCVFLLPFDHRPGQAVWGRPADIAVRGAIDSAPMGGGTALYDAVVLASLALAGGGPQDKSACGDGESGGGPGGETEGRTESPRRQAIVVLTDGGDQNSRLTFSDALMEAWGSRIPVFPIGIGEIVDPQAMSGPAFQFRAPGDRTREIRHVRQELDDLAVHTGGRVVFSRRLDRAYAEILNLLRASYVVGYRPPSPPGSEPVWHEVRIETQRPGARVLARDGYYAAPVDRRATARLLEDSQAENEPEVALLLVDAALRADPESDRAHLARALLLREQARVSEALDAALAATRMAPANAVAAQLAAELSLAEGDAEAAWDLAVRAHLGGRTVRELFDALEAAAPPPADFDLRLVAPLVYVARPEIPDVPAQFLLAPVRRALETALAESADYGVVESPWSAEYELRIELDGDPSQTHPSVRGELAVAADDAVLFRTDFEIDDVDAADVVAATIAELLDEMTRRLLGGAP